MSPDSLRSFARLAASKWWLVGSIALLVGYVVQAIALDHGRLAIIQPLLVTTVVFALPLGYFLTAQESGSARSSAPRWSFSGWRCTRSSAIRRAATKTRRTTSGASRSHHRSRVRRPLRGSSQERFVRQAAFYGVVSGILFGVSACLVKPTLEALHDGGVSEALSTGSSTGWRYRHRGVRPPAGLAERRLPRHVRGDGIRVQPDRLGCARHAALRRAPEPTGVARRRRGVRLGARDARSGR